MVVFCIYGNWVHPWLRWLQSLSDWLGQWFLGQWCCCSFLQKSRSHQSQYGMHCTADYSDTKIEIEGDRYWSTSALERLWIIYGSDSFTHMLDVHAYSRALRLHTLYSFWDNKCTRPNVQLCCTSIINAAVCTCKAQYSGYFALHLHGVAQMQPYFHAAERLQYTKSSQVYFPTMKDLEEKMPWLLYNPSHKQGLVCCVVRHDCWASFDEGIENNRRIYKRSANQQ